MKERHEEELGVELNNEEWSYDWKEKQKRRQKKIMERGKRKVTERYEENVWRY